MAPPTTSSMPSTTGGSPTIPHEALVQQKQGMAIMIWTIGAFCIFGWEWIVCLPKEYRRIWRRPKNVTIHSYCTL
ncbi:hypothetical protein CVT26_011452 [Gymnopilus dilepis]|uniref:DUF6533 domain-containing protein n=1 Tax=Gymnopilus dilepis TaxID=231916 RepID=A0A409W8R5_9AGAR|nr:hypothetical protein CVT26_011452 [Gymnopilus dilepis]